MGVKIVEVFYKEGVFDADGENIKKDIISIGIDVKEVLTSKLYKFDGNVSTKDLKKISEELLIDPIIQSYNISKKRKVENSICVNVWYKKGVTDTVAETVLKGVRDLKIMTKLKVSTGQRYIIRGLSQPEKIDLICQRILANTIIQDYEIH